MYNDELIPQTIPLSQIYLDPNNPRFWTTERRPFIPDRRATEESVQARVEASLEPHGILELRNSILRNGFLRMDRIVVRRLEKSGDHYVVIEGNRRLAALRRLRQEIDGDRIAEEQITSEYLDELRLQTDSIEVLVYQGSDTADISWILQGIRHISGVRDWTPAQRAKLVVDQVDLGSSFRKAGQTFGLSSHAVGRLYRAYKALMQMRVDDVYGDEVRDDYFTLFEEAYRNSVVRQWLDWNEKNARFEEEQHLRIFYSWIVPDPEDADHRRRIHNPKHVKCLATLLQPAHQGWFAKVDRHDMRIDDAERATQETQQQIDWIGRLRNLLEVVRSVPAGVISANPDLTALLDEIIVELRQYRRMASMPPEGNGDGE